MATYQLNSSSDLIENPSPRCACMLVLDTSASMFGQPIRELNSGVQAFISAIKEDDMAACSVELGVITAGGKVTEQLPFTTAMNISQCRRFVASGLTPLGAAMDLALDRLEERTAAYRKAGVAYYQPWLVVISDGVPTDQWQAASARARSLAQQRKMVVMPVGVEEADLDALGAFSTRPAKRLDGLKFREFFLWLSASMSRVSASASTTEQVRLPPTDSWDSI
ncbi:VWA domain-containing protein [Halomonas sp. DQ26W]|uniref:vWA domain-containing protein n=1 Tax=Halomonas sp. DQ26W TaxID=2282311 RepID=UPI000DF85AED|nr:VWA domain-containing protein [Halomonas sp. DQ26W]RDB44900.1 VWA domain-containing protein [Halomonas sp. DQ26W]